MRNRFKETTRALREELGVSQDRRPDVGDLLVRLRITGRIAGFRTVSSSDLPDDVDARWDPTNRFITVRQSVFDGAIAGSPQHRFTIAHEIGHAILGHPERNRRLDGRVQFGRHIAAHELEANDFAMSFLAPMELIDLAVVTAPQELAEEFGIPLDVANIWFASVESEPGWRSRRKALPASKTRIILIDTGNYEDAMWAMSRNTEKHSSD